MNENPLIKPIISIAKLALNLSGTLGKVGHSILRATGSWHKIGSGSEAYWIKNEITLIKLDIFGWVPMTEDPNSPTPDVTPFSDPHLAMRWMDEYYFGRGD